MTSTTASEKRKITFTCLRAMCDYHEIRWCIHERNKTVGPFKDGKCKAENCPIWKRMEK